QVFLFGHAEYDRDTLKKEYDRDVAAGIDIDVPKNYYPDNDPTKPPKVSWRSCANLLYSNWLNYFVYQTTPYDLAQIK
ncbi:MAG: homoserine O-succinyltransferase, partial [Oscillospiraceae bacterium]|nr:homoserine O-succinyltransferase [Oscillospiraceae bacterium]